MPDPNTFARLVLTTASSPEEAARLGRTLVEEGLAACVSVIPGILSIYRWQGAVEDTHEALLLIKTSQDQLAALEVRLHQLHSYQTPEFLVFNPESGSPAYMAWLAECLGKG